MLYNQKNTLALLRRHRARMAKDFGVGRIALFGSVARNSMKATSDIDILVDFTTPTFDHYFDLKFYLENLFQRKVDLVCRDSLRPRIRPVIERDAIDVA